MNYLQVDHNIYAPIPFPVWFLCDSVGPSPPGALSGFTTSTTINVTWTAAEGDVSYYEVEYSPNTEGSTPSPSYVGADEPLTLLLNTLLPQKTYLVTVTSVAGEGDTESRSDSVEQEFTTRNDRLIDLKNCRLID